MDQSGVTQNLLDNRSEICDTSENLLVPETVLAHEGGIIPDQACANCIREGRTVIPAEY